MKFIKKVEKTSNHKSQQKNLHVKYVRKEKPTEKIIENLENLKIDKDND